MMINEKVLNALLSQWEHFLQEVQRHSSTDAKAKSITTAKLKKLITQQKPDLLSYSTCILTLLKTQLNDTRSRTLDDEKGMIDKLNLDLFIAHFDLLSKIYPETKFQNLENNYFKELIYLLGDTITLLNTSLLQQDSPLPSPKDDEPLEELPPINPIKTTLFSQVEHRVSQLLPQSQSCAVDIQHSYVNLCWQKYNHDSAALNNVLTDAVVWAQHMGLNPPTAEDLIESTMGVLPFLHVALYRKDPFLISKALSLPRSQHEIINPVTLQSSLHVLASTAENDANEIIYYLSRILDPQLISTAVLYLDNQKQTFLHTAFLNKTLSEHLLFQITAYIFDRIDTPTLKRLVLQMDANNQTILSLCAANGFSRILDYVVRSTIKRVLPIENAQQESSFLRHLFNNPTLLPMARTNNHLHILKYLIDIGAAEFLPSKDKQTFKDLGSTTLIHGNIPIGWTPQSSLHTMEKLALGTDYWYDLYTTALILSTNYFEQAKYKTLINAISPANPQKKTPFDLAQLNALNNRLSEWEIHLLSLKSYFPNRKKSQCFQISRNILESRFFNILIYMLILGALVSTGAVLIWYGRIVEFEVDSTAGQELDDQCIAYGGKPHGGYGYWSIWSETAFKKYCCISNPLCIDELTPLWQTVLKDHHIFRASKFIGGLLVGFSIFIAMGIQRAYFIATDPIMERLTKFIKKANDYQEGEIYTQNINTLNANLRAFFECLLKHQVPVSSVVKDFLSTTDLMINKKNIELLALAKLDIKRFLLEEYTHDYGFEFPDFAPPELPESNTATTQTILTHWKIHTEPTLETVVTADDSESDNERQSLLAAGIPS